uniref:Posterior midgut dominant protein n=1 Tax=Brachyplatys vahlii TaxID=355285 RepID=A0A8E4BR59_9HEMI|nr:posterior midgut dominant protein [Brachyplatys vahlii]
MRFVLYLLAAGSIACVMATHRHEHNKDSEYHHGHEHVHERSSSGADDSSEESGYNDDDDSHDRDDYGKHHGRDSRGDSDRHHEYYKKNLREALKCCASEHDAEMKDIFKAIRGQGHDTHAAKCAVGCWLDKMGYIKNKKICWDSVKKDAQNLYEDKDDIKRAQKVVDKVSEDWREKITDKCRQPIRALRFLLKKAKKAGLSKPDYHFKKSYSKSYDELAVAVL